MSFANEKSWSLDNILSKSQNRKTLVLKWIFYFDLGREPEILEFSIRCTFWVQQQFKGFGNRLRNEMPCIDFGAIVHTGRSAVRVYSDGRVDAVELAMVVSDKSRDNAGKQLRNLDPKLFNPAKFMVIKLPGKGNLSTKTLDCSDAMDLVMVLPGNASKVIRKKFADIIVRYLDGDITMCAEIKKNRDMGRSASYTNFIQDTMKQIMEEQEQEQAGHLPTISYIYASKSAAFPGLIKIGKTQDVAQRLSQLNTGCAPAPHTVVAVATTFNKDKDEKEAHQHFAAFRREGEFFEVSELDVQTYFSLVTAKFHVDMNQRLQGSLIHAMS